ncbi:MAG TPA: hypothetical protein VFG54_12345 [Prolixibacteraceae bacterium]|nr:hypothetical protein [Prolixibacteraceae bacterium]
MFCKDARAYIMKLIKIRTYLLKEGYTGEDQPIIVEAIEHLKRYLEYYRYDSDDKMRSFFYYNNDRIRALIPGENYPGYQKLMNEFLNYKNQ